MQLSLMTLCLLLAIFSLLVMTGSIVFSNQGSRRSNYLLAAFFFSITLILVNFLLMTSELVLTMSWAAYLGNTLGLSAGPLLYLYARSLTDETFKIDMRRLAHLIPVAILVLIVLFGYTRLSHDARLSILSGQDTQTILNAPALRVAAFGVVFGYLGATFRVIRKFRARRREFFTSAGPGDLTWLTASIIAAFSLWSLSLLHEILISIWPIRWLDQTFLTVMAVSSLGLGLYLLANGLRQARVVPGFVPIEIQTQGTTSLDKYGDQRLGTEEIKEFVERIEREIETGESIFDPALTLTQFAEMTSMTPRELSQTINRHYEKSFFDFVNAHRILRATNELLGDENVSITEIIYTCGFSSKSSFYSAFRKETGMTPTDFKNKAPKVE